MKRLHQVSKFMFAATGVLWILESIGEMFGRFVEDFNSNFDYLSEFTFGFSFLTFFIAAFTLVRANQEQIRLGWTGKIGIGFLSLAGCLMPIKSLSTASLGFIGGYPLVTQYASFIDPIFLLSVLTALLGSIFFGINCLQKKYLSKLSSILLLVSFLLVFIPVVGKYLTAAIYFMIAAELHKKQVKIDDNQNINVTITN
jgi:hypothetical protein